MQNANKRKPLRQSKPPKKKKLDIDISNGPQITSPLSAILLSDESQRSLSIAHSKSLPYRNVVFDPLCENERMRLVWDEARRLSATYKETDLFKLYQTCDLANIKSSDSIAVEMPQLLALRDSIYSPAFRNFVIEVTGCGELIDRVDCAANAYVGGSHLLCHDDVIGNRKVSYIIYLTDPDEEWLPSDGGMLELYPLEPEGQLHDTLGNIQGIPTTIPTTLIPPKFNTMALFIVQPGRSYHAVQEVFTKDKPRLSIQGWFHGPSPPVGSDMASLKQIMNKGERSTFLFQPLLTLPNTPHYTTEELDIQYLSQYINPLYLTTESMNSIHKSFCKDSSIQLFDFIIDSLANKIKQSMINIDKNDNIGHSRPPASYEVGIRDGWTAIGPTHKRRYLSYNDLTTSSTQTQSTKITKKIKKCNLGTLLNNVLTKLTQTTQFARYLQKLTTLQPTAQRGEVRRFRAGLDYTVAYYGAMSTESRLDATLCFVDCSDDESDELWAEGDVGGFECYLAADDSNADATDAAEVYRTDTTEDDQLLSVSPAFNVLNLVLRDEGTMRFVKYVSSSAPGSRWDVSVEYDIVQSETKEEEENEDDDSSDSTNSNEEKSHDESVDNNSS